MYIVTKLFDIDIKTDRWINRIKLKTQMQIDKPMDTSVLTKRSKLYNGKNKVSSTNGAGITGYQHAEECELSRIYHMAQN